MWKKAEKDSDKLRESLVNLNFKHPKEGDIISVEQSSETIAYAFRDSGRRSPEN